MSRQIRSMNPSVENCANFDVLIVESGLQECTCCTNVGNSLSTQVFEVGKGVGGTWYWNRYPGARCDVESVQYSYQFDTELEQEWTWSEKYSTQPEILRYANHVADRFDLRDNIQFETRVISAEYSEADKLWVLETDRNEKVSSRYCVFATGCLPRPLIYNSKALKHLRGCPTTRADGRMKELTFRSAGRSYWDGLLSNSVYSRDCKEAVNLHFSEQQTILYQRETRN